MTVIGPFQLVMGAHIFEVVIIMGTRGPVPKTNEQRRRTNKDSQLTEIEISTSPAIQPKESPHWCEAAKRIWQAMGNSAQVIFFEATDWAYAQLMCDLITDYMHARRSNSQMVASILSGLTSLMLTEGDRRRAGIELKRVTSTQHDSTIEDMTTWATKLA